jgi:hypothetical protein
MSLQKKQCNAPLLRLQITVENVHHCGIVLHCWPVAAAPDRLFAPTHSCSLGDRSLILHAPVLRVKCRLSVPARSGGHMLCDTEILVRLPACPPSTWAGSGMPGCAASRWRQPVRLGTRPQLAGPKRPLYRITDYINPEH